VLFRSRIAVNEPSSEQSFHAARNARHTAGRLASGTVGCAGSMVAALIGVLFVAYVIAWFQKPSLGIVGSIERWVYFVGNLIVACYCFPAYRSSKQRAFLYLAFASLGFAYGTLFTLLFGPRLPADSRSQLVLFYGIKHFIETAGLVLYAAGVVSLAREAQRRTMRSNQTLEPTAGRCDAHI